MGALTYQPEFDLHFSAENNLELDVIANQVNQVLKGESADVIEELYQLGGSSGGARPKILVGYNAETETLIHGTTEIPNDYDHWIIKFPSSSDSPDIANIEFAYYKMALDAGIKMNPSQLFTGKSGKQYFGTKRFDRNQNRRLHIHSACGLLHDNFRQSTMDYGHLMDCTFRLERNVEAYSKILKLATFNVFAHNRDDHSKNFSFLMDETGKWELAPAYDLTYSASGFGMHSTTVAGEGKSPGKKQLLELAKHFSIKKADETIEQVRQVISGWNKYADSCGVSNFSKKQIDKTIMCNKS
jgi:serine/threonine-protein kinase HipA